MSTFDNIAGFFENTLDRGLEGFSLFLKNDQIKNKQALETQRSLAEQQFLLNQSRFQQDQQQRQQGSGNNNLLLLGALAVGGLVLFQAAR